MAPGGVLRRWLLLLLLLWVLAGHAAGPSAPTCAAQYPCLQFSVAETATPDTYDSQAGNGCWTGCLFRVCLTGHFSDASCGLGPSDSLQKVCPVSLSGACPPPSDSSWNSCSGRPGDSPASPGEGRVALTAPEGSAMAAVWRALLQKSEHRNFAHPEALDSLLEQLQVALAPREATGAPRDLKTLAPEDRLKIRIRALQQMGEQVLGPRLFGQMYAALKRPNEPARRELLDLARQDPVLNAAVAHINQLLLCENLYFG